VPTNRNAPDPPDDHQDPPDATDGSSAREPTAEGTEIRDWSQIDAEQLRDSSYALFMYGSLRPGLKYPDVEAYRLYRARLLAESGNPSDPIEEMIIEQLALAHLNVGLYQTRANNATTLVEATAFAGAAARLIAEFRRSALALQAYRAASRQLANDPSKDIVLPVEQVEVCDVLPGKDDPDTEKLAIKEASDGDDGIIPYPGPTASGDQPPQQAEVARVHGRRKGKSPRRNSGNQTLGDDHRAANG
jgi:hypothetical protein